MGHRNSYYPFAYHKCTCNVKPNKLILNPHFNIFWTNTMNILNATPTQRIIRNTILYTLGFILVALAGRVGLAFPAFFVAAALLFLGPFYVLFVLIITLTKRKKERIVLDNMDEPTREQLTHEPAYTFNTPTQIHTFANNILLTLSTIGFSILGYIIWKTSDAEDWQDVALWTLGTALVTQTILLIIINIGLVYTRRIRIPEQHALRTRTGAWKLILTNRVWSWGIWTVGALMGTVGIISTFVIDGGI